AMIDLTSISSLLRRLPSHALGEAQIVCRSLSLLAINLQGAMVGSVDPAWQLGAPIILRAN
ncbi:MAG TPA: hypothetical protein VH593_03110, partial [Ktedonobacteraceae bacterium]